MFINQDQVQLGFAMLNMGFPPIDAAMVSHGASRWITSISYWPTDGLIKLSLIFE